MSERRESLRLEEYDDLETVVNVAIGAATSCWENLRGAGIFDSDRAKRIADELVEEIGRRHASSLAARNQVLDQLVQEVYENNLEKGWFDEDRTVGEELALLHSEISEAFDAYREIGMAYRDAPLEHLPSCPASTPEGMRAPCGGECIPKPDDVASEIADTFIRILDFCKRHDVDLAAEYERKMRYNRTRPYRHGGKRL